MGSGNVDYVKEEGSVDIDELAKTGQVENILEKYRNSVSDIIQLGDRKTSPKTALVNQGNYIKWKDAEGNYRSGYYPFFIAKAVEKILRGEDIKIAVCGQTGRGKSMKALRIAEILHNEIGICHGNWTPDLQIYDVEEFLSTLVVDDPSVNGFFKTYIFDEAARTLKKEQYMSPFNSAVRQTLNLQRIRQNVYIFVLPYFEKLDTGIKKHMDIKIVCRSRKKATVFYNRKKFEADSTADAYDWRRDKRNWTGIPMPDEDLVDEYRQKEMREKLLQPADDLRKVREKRREQQKDGGGLGIMDM